MLLYCYRLIWNSIKISSFRSFVITSGLPCGFVIKSNSKVSWKSPIACALLYLRLAFTSIRCIHEYDDAVLAPAVNADSSVL